MFEEDRQLPVKGQVQDRDELTLDAVPDAGSGSVGDLSGQQDRA